MNELMKKLLGNKWMTALVAVGILLLAFGASGGAGLPPGNAGGGGSKPPSGAGSGTAAAGAGTGGSSLQTAMAYQQLYDRELTAMIDQISGVSDALVMVTVSSTPSRQFGQNVTVSRQSTVQSGNGGSTTTTSQSTQSQMVTVQGSNGNQTPILVQEQMPHIAGVLVEARAADVVRMEAEITGAVQDALGIPSYEITVLPRK